MLGGNSLSLGLVVISLIPKYVKDLKIDVKDKVLIL
jgi:hypothetical protein